MTKTGTLVLLALGLAVATGCKKEETQGYIAPPAGTNPVRATIADARANANQSFTVNASSGGVVYGAHGTIITMQPGAFRNHSGAVVNGAVTVELMEALTISEMVRTNMQTVAVHGGTKYMLQSGGAVRLRAMAGGEHVTVAPGAVVVQIGRASCRERV